MQNGSGLTKHRRLMNTQSFIHLFIMRAGKHCSRFRRIAITRFISTAFSRRSVSTRIFLMIKYMIRWMFHPIVKREKTILPLLFGITASIRPRSIIRETPRLFSTSPAAVKAFVQARSVRFRERVLLMRTTARRSSRVSSDFLSHTTRRKMISGKWAS